MENLAYKQLMKRLDENMAAFKAALYALDKDTLIKEARKISAVDDVYFQLTTQTEYDDGDAEYLLLFQNPLEILADQWVSRLDEVGVDFDVCLYEFFDKDDNTKQYPLMSDIDTTDYLDLIIKDAEQSIGLSVANELLAALRNVMELTGLHNQDETADE